MKKNIVVSSILFFILGGIMFGTIGAYAATSISSSSVSYGESDVKTSIDELYSKTTYGDATSGDILSGKKALVNGKQVTGTNAGYDVGYSSGVAAADARVYNGSASYTAGYDAGVAAGKSSVSGTYVISGSCSASGESGGYIWGTRASSSTSITVTVKSDGTISASGSTSGNASAAQGGDLGTKYASCSSSNLSVTKK